MSITVASCVPRQAVTVEAKIDWLRETLKKTPCDLFLLPQEFIGGHYGQILAEQHGEPLPDLHVSRSWVEETFGGIARDYHKALGVGACVIDDEDRERGTEDYVYFESDGAMAGYHRKFALPSYDDVRTKGAGRLWPEQVWKVRVTPIELASLGLRVGTVFCWEVFAATLVPFYSLAKTNLLTHPIKFAPRGWLTFDPKADKKAPDYEKRITGFGHAPKSQEWIARLKMLGRHEALCPIAISCNTWNLGDKFKALTGHVDELLGTTNIVEVGSEQKAEYIHTFTMNPAYYLAGTDNSFSLGAFKEATGSLEGHKALYSLKMHLKMRRLESHLLNDTTRLECFMKAQALRTKRSVHQRAEARGLLKASQPTR